MPGQGTASRSLQTDLLATVHIHGRLCSLLSCILRHSLHLHAICLLCSLQQIDNDVAEVGGSRTALLCGRHAFWAPLQYLTGSTQTRGAQMLGARRAAVLCQDLLNSSGVQRYHCTAQCRHTLHC